MTTVADVIKVLARAGITVTVRDGELVARPAARVTPTYAKLLELHRAALLAACAVAPVEADLPDTRTRTLYQLKTHVRPGATPDHYAARRLYEMLLRDGFKVVTHRAMVTVEPSAEVDTWLASEIERLRPALLLVAQAEADAGGKA